MAALSKADLHQAALVPSPLPPAPAATAPITPPLFAAQPAVGTQQARAAALTPGPMATLPLYSAAPAAIPLPAAAAAPGVAAAQLAPAPAEAAPLAAGFHVPGPAWGGATSAQPQQAAPDILSSLPASSSRGSSTASLLQGITGAVAVSDRPLNPQLTSSTPLAQPAYTALHHTADAAPHPAVGLGGPANLPPSPFLGPHPAAQAAACPQQFGVPAVPAQPTLLGAVAAQPNLAAGQPGISASLSARAARQAQLAPVPELSSVAIPMDAAAAGPGGLLPLHPVAGPAAAHSQAVPPLAGTAPAPLAAAQAGPQHPAVPPSQQPGTNFGACAQAQAVRPASPFLTAAPGGTTMPGASIYPTYRAAGSPQLSEHLAALSLHSQACSEAGSVRSGGASAGALPAGSAWSTGGSSAASSARVAAAFAATLDSPSRQLEHAAVASQQLAAQKQAEQHAAAAAYRQAASDAACALDPAAARRAVAAAQDAAATFSAAASDAAAAQQTSSQLHQAAVVTAAAEASPGVMQLKHAAAATHQVALQKQVEQRAAVAAYQAAATQAVAATDQAAAGVALAAAQTAAQAFSAATSEAAAAEAAACQLQQQAAAAVSVVAASSQLPPGGGPVAAAGLPAMAHPVAPNPPSPAAVQLAGAAAAAQQVHAQKATEHRNAAAVYHAATAQAAAASSLQAQAHAAVAVQQAAAAYTAAASEAAAAANAADQLQKAALAAAAVQMPASAPLAASIAAGMPLPPALPLPVAGQPLVQSMPGLAVPAVGVAAALASSAASAVTGGGSTPSLASSQRHSGSAAASSLPHGRAGPAAAYATPPAASVLPHVAGLVGAQGVAAPMVAAPVAAAVGALPTVALAPTAAGVAHVHWAPSCSSGTAGSAQPPQVAGQPSPPPSAYRSVSAWSQQAAGIARTCKVVCSTGGSFVQLAQGGWDYEGGDTRLVAVPFHCDFPALVEALERAAAPPGGASCSAESASDAAPRTFAPSIKYRLPSDPSVWVDLLDDDDVALMFDEYDEHRNGASAPAKLHLFVQWRGPQEVIPAGSEDQGSEQHSEQLSGQLSGKHSGQQRHTDHGYAQGGSGAGAGSNDGVGASGGSARRPAGGYPPRRGSVDLCALVEKMEIIDPADIQLMRFLGSGGYGDVYLARWHGSDVAVKCMNPSLFFGTGEFSGTNRAAIIDLIKEADLLGSMRHPNVVWVYGIVLPRSALEGGGAPCDSGSSGASDGGRESGEDDGSGADVAGPAPSLAGTAASRPRSDMVDALASGMRRSGMSPNMVRPPALVTEYMAGGSLKSALARRADIVAGPLTRVVLALDAAKGMEYLHSKCLVHFDLKSANLLLGYRDRRPICKVADFGLSKQKLQTYVSGVSSQRGTLPWTAPEILRTPDAVTEKVDVYSFGVVMWELWTGLEPFAGLNYHALMLRLANPRERLRPPVPGAPDWEGEAPPEPAPGWRDLMERCWSDDPAARPPFSELIADLRSMASAIKPRRDGSTRSGVAQQGGAGLSGSGARQGA